MTNLELDGKYDNLSRLCEALNNIPFVNNARYWGGEHNPEYLNVAFDLGDIKSLMIITRALDNRYGGQPRYEESKNWFLYVECIDSEPGYVFGLRSFCKEEYAYEWANRIADNIEDTLGRDNVLELYGIKRENEVEAEKQKEMDKQEYKKLLEKAIRKYRKPLLGLDV